MLSNKNSTSRSFASLLLIAFVVFLYLGLRINLLYLSGAIMSIALIWLSNPTKRKLGYVLAAFSVIYFLVVFGYSIGKDMAKRDNTQDAVKSTIPSNVR